MANKWIVWWDVHKPTNRRLIQIYAALLYNAHIRGFIEGEIYTGATKVACVPGLNCYSCPGAVGACPLGALQNALASSNNRAPFYVIGILLLYGLTLGRTICGWLCPLGLIQELFYKIPTLKLRKNRFTHVLSYLKYAILGIFVIAIPLAYGLQYFPVPAFCKYICPAGTFEGSIGLLANPVNAAKLSILNILFTNKFIIMVLIFTSCVFIYRAFCRFLCPLGAIYGIFARLSVVGVKVELNKCTNCGRCVSCCKMDIRRVGDHECIDCGECIGVCPTKAISLKAGRIGLLAGETEMPKQEKRIREMRGRITWMAALAVLVGVLLCFNLLDNKEVAAPDAIEEAGEKTNGSTVERADDTLIGYEIGMRCPDFTVPLYNMADESFTLSEVRGKPVVLNFWATWCAPCVGELPWFQRIYDEYGDRIAIIAIHSSMITDDVQEWLDREEYTIPFGLDETGEINNSLGDATMLPMTVVLDADGKIVYNKNASVTYELLVSLLEPLL